MNQKALYQAPLAPDHPQMATTVRAQGPTLAEPPASISQLHFIAGLLKSGLCHL
jgi:hypothetical protein